MILMMIKIKFKAHLHKPRLYQRTPVRSQWLPSAVAVDIIKSHIMIIINTLDLITISRKIQHGMQISTEMNGHLDYCE